MTAPEVILTEAAALERLALSVRYRNNRDRLLAAARRLRDIAGRALATAPTGA